MLTEFPWITLAAVSMRPKGECGDDGKYLYVVTFHFMTCGVWDSWRTLPCWQFYLTLTGSPWHQSIPKPFSLSSRSSWISVSVQSTPGRGTTSAPLLVCSRLVPCSLGTHLISGLLVITPSFLGNGESSC